MRRLPLFLSVLLCLSAFGTQLAGVHRAAAQTPATPQAQRPVPPAANLQATSANLFMPVGAELNGVEQSSSSVGDFNGDGNPDLILTGETSSFFLTSTVYLGDGTGGFSKRRGNGLAGVEFSSSSVGDLNADGNLDVLITGYDSNFNRTAQAYLGDGTGTFSAADAGLTGVFRSSSAIGDFNEDSIPDMVITGYDSNFNPTATVYLGDGTGGFSPAGAGLVGVRDGSSSVGDFNGDGMLDLLITGADANGDLNPTATVYLGDGTGGFSPAGAELGGVTSSSSSVGDFNEDGFLDLLITGLDASFDPSAAVYLGDGTGGFSPAGAGLTGVEDGSSSVGDVNGDGTLDLVITGTDPNSDKTTTVYLGDGTGQFRPAGAGLNGAYFSSTSVADFDSDGLLDVVVAGRNSDFKPATTVYRNVGAADIPVGSASQNVRANGPVTFGETGLTIDFAGVSGTGRVQVRRFGNAPNNPIGLFDETVSSYRVDVSAEGTLAFSDQTEVRFPTNAFGGINVPSNVTVYRRAVRDNGRFEPLPTTYDADAGVIAATTQHFSEFVLASTDPSNPLPVELAALEAVKDDGGVVVRWRTASETNNAGFAIDHQAPGASSFAKLGFIEGAGTTNEAQFYRFRLERPVPGTHRFRLRQKDVGGAETNSPVTAVQVGLNKPYRLSPASPNPARQHATLWLSVRKAQSVRAQLYNVMGQQVAMVYDGAAVAGAPVRLRVGGTALPSGTYFVRVIGETFQATRRLTVVR